MSSRRDCDTCKHIKLPGFMEPCVNCISATDTRGRRTYPRWKPKEDRGLKGGQKHDAGKPRWDLIPPAALEEVAKVLEFGARKYAPDNWRKVNGWRWRYARAAIGHIFEWLRGRKKDPESGLHPLAHAACSVLFLLEKETER